MHIQRLKIKEYRNLKDFQIRFTQSLESSNSSSDESRNFKSHAVIGQNATGKSNLLEALVTIFRDLDLNNAAALDYEMDYTIREHNVQVIGASGKKPKVVINNKRSSARARF